MMEQFDKSIKGQRFGKLIAIEYNHTDKHGNACWLCRCDCGNESVVSRNDLLRGKTKSCGCKRHEKRFEDLSDKNLEGYSYSISIICRYMVYLIGEVYAIVAMKL